MLKKNTEHGRYESMMTMLIHRISVHLKANVVTCICGSSPGSTTAAVCGWDFIRVILNREYMHTNIHDINIQIHKKQKIKW